MRKTLLIARREYLAFVRTAGFWLSLVTLPLLITGIILVPILLRQSTPVQVIDVAVVDVSGEHLEAPLRAMVQKHVRPPVVAGKGGFMESVGDSFAHRYDVRLHDVPPGLVQPGLDPATLETKLAGHLDGPVNTWLIAYKAEEGGVLFRVLSRSGGDDKLEDLIHRDLADWQFYRVAGQQGVSPEVAKTLREARVDIESVTPADLKSEGRDNGLQDMLHDGAPHVVGAMMGYFAWMTIFSSSMILLSGVIEEKSSKVLEVLLASTSTESLLIGKVLGVAMVLLTVGAIWGGAGFALLSYGAQAMPADIVQAIRHGLSGLFTPLHLGLLAAYFVGGYLMFGVTFSAIGAFCETQKDAQAIMGPVMMVLMVPMLCMQAAFTAPGSPIITWLSYVPIFTPFLMPLRLAEPLPWWEIAATLGGMAVVGGFMVMVGRRAFRQGALTGGKLTWGMVAKIATRRPEN